MDFFLDWKFKEISDYSKIDYSSASIKL